MKAKRNNTLKLKLSGAEAGHLKTLMEKLEKEGNKIGFQSAFSDAEKDLIKELNQKL